MAPIRRVVRAGLSALFVALLAGAAGAQPAAPPDNESAALAKATQNPVADLVTFPFQFNFFSGGALGTQTLSQINFQPVMPLAISAEWNVIARTIVPFVSIPLPSGDRSSGIGDIQEQLFFTPAKPGGLIWGFGPQLSLPTATNTSISTGQLAVGPSAVALKMPGNWVVGGVLSNVWRIAGSDSGADINQLTFQPLLNYNFKGGWALSSAPVITANWSAPSGEEWTVPIGLGVSKVDRIGARPVSVALQYYHLAKHPPGSGDDQWRLALSLLYPKAKPR